VDEDPDYQSDLTKIRSALSKAHESLRIANKALELARGTVQDLQRLISDECLALGAGSEVEDAPSVPSPNGATQHSNGKSP
jgi:hypothetical protein